MNSPSRSRPKIPPLGALDAAMDANPAASLSSLGPLTHAILFLQNVTGIAPIDLARNADRRIVALIAHGDCVTIGLPYDDGSF